jgi:hypothetical protein
MNAILEFLSNLIGASWRTTILGWLLIVSGIGTALAATGAFGKAILDSDPTTVGDFEGLAYAWKTVVAGIAFLFTRDNAVTSESAGAKK